MFSAKGRDDPVAPRPGEALLVLLIAVGVRVSRDIEPFARHALGVGLGGKQSVHDPFTSLRTGVGQEGRNLVGAGRQAGQIEGDAAEPFLARGGGSGRQAGGGDFFSDETVNRVDGPVSSGGGDGNTGGWRNQRPVSFVGSSGGDPRLEHGLFLFGKLKGRIRRRHHLIRVLRVDALDELTARGITGHDARVATQVGHGLGSGVESEFGFLVFRVRPMALVALVRKNGSDVLIETDRGLILRAARDGLRRLGSG